MEKARVAVAVTLVLQHNQRAFTLESVAIPDELLVLVGIHKTLLITGLLEILESVLVLGLSILGGFIGLRVSDGLTFPPDSLIVKFTFILGMGRKCRAWLPLPVESLPCLPSRR